MGGRKQGMEELLPLLLLVLMIPVWTYAMGSDPPLSSMSAPPDPSPRSLPSSPVSTSMAAFTPELPTGGRKHRLDSHEKLLVALIASCSLLGAIILIFMGLWVYHNKFNQKSSKKSCQRSETEKGLSLAPFLGKFSSLKTVSRKSSVAFFENKLLEKASNSFSDSNILGVGGFGRVYKARLDDNKHVAIKKLDCGSQDAVREFENEVDLLSKMQHPNVISLLGYGINDETRFIVYELMQNGSLETQLHGLSQGSALTWHTRMKIALDTARGLEYLHEHCNPPVIHRDLKSSNILLDANFNAKLSDFGLAVTDGSQNKNNVKLSGTLGYVAPEYLLDDRLTDKSDVYAFGVVLLELLLGRKPVEKLAPAQCQSIVTWAMPQLTDRSKLPNIVDPAIKDTMDMKHLYQVAAVAVLCVQPEPSYRPLITDVLHSLIPLVPVELGGTLRAAVHSNN
ncbi:hypothetical protein BT93_L0989 [Corymbia citriodora subsp. variegata]|uniref:Protein kinase domain-containing protein n=1 Tax=Corymbia citriodora subsp. variegata TaxID=360336 RepID=A0A8T0CNS5_CORYI|nr:hypothetical protein BT93_L0989 [Corymbia citriodora subsp. variegata]